MKYDLHSGKCPNVIQNDGLCSVESPDAIQNDKATTESLSLKMNEEVHDDNNQYPPGGSEITHSQGMKYDLQNSGVEVELPSHKVHFS